MGYSFNVPQKISIAKINSKKSVFQTLKLYLAGLTLNGVLAKLGQSLDQISFFSHLDCNLKRPITITNTNALCSNNGILLTEQNSTL